LEELDIELGSGEFESSLVDGEAEAAIDTDAETILVEPGKTDVSEAAQAHPAPALADATVLIDQAAYEEDLQPEGRLELPEMDQDLLDIFVQEGNDILDHSDSVMAQLRDAPQDRELIVNLQRDLHTLKGGARMAGIGPIGDLTHAMESLLDATYDGHRSMDLQSVEALERSYDALHGLVQRIARREAIAMPEQMIARLEKLVAGESVEAAAPRPAVDSVSAAPVAADKQAEPVPETQPAQARS